MGDRANIFLVEDRESTVNVQGIYLYTHWNGYEWPERLREALAAGRDRWGDESYLNRVIVSSVFADLTGNTGGGISLQIGDNSYPIVIVDHPAQRVCWASEGNERDRSKWTHAVSFADFVAQDKAGYPA